MDMKKSFLLAALIAAAMPSIAQQVKYSVSGTCDKEGKKVYLIDKLTDSEIDSVVVTGGKFSFSGTTDKDALMGVTVRREDWTTLFFNDGTPVAINLNDSTLKGSPLNERLTKYDIEADIPGRAMKAKLSKLTREEIEEHAEEIME